MIHVCFCFYDKTGHYSKLTGTAMLSLFENTIAPPRSITVHLIHDNTLTQDNREKFIYVAGQYNQLVKFYNVEERCAEKIETIKQLLPVSVNLRTTIGAFYRLFIPQLLSPGIKRAIYLDSDLIVNMDINELWRIELGDKILAAVTEMEMGSSVQRLNFYLYLCRTGIVKHEDYFASGMLLMDLEALRAEEEKILSGFNFAREHNQPSFSDQDILNYCFAGNILKLPTKFSRPVHHARRAGEKLEEKIYQYSESQIGNGLGLDGNDIFDRLWMHHFIKTPWFDEKAIGRLYEGVRQMNVGLKNSMLKISAMMSGKTRAFFTLQPNVDATKKIFSIRDNEEIILADKPDSLQKLIDAMKLSKGKKVFFILVQGFPFQMLTQAGFVFAEDFLDGMEFLSEAHGIKFNSYPLLNAM